MLQIFLHRIDVVFLLGSRVRDQVGAVGLARLLRPIEIEIAGRGEVAPPVDQRPRGVQTRALDKTLKSYVLLNLS